MRALMGLIKDRHGTYYARQKVPERLQEAVASILDNGKHKQVWLKRSLGTKVLPKANVRAKPVLMQFDQIIARAEDHLKEWPVRSSLSDIEIKRITDFFLARALAVDEERRIAGRGDDLMFRSSWGHDDLKEPIERGRGLSPGMMETIQKDTEFVLATSEDQLARGDIMRLRGEVDELLKTFHINLDPKCADYFKLARALQGAFVKYLRAVLARQKGEPIETPPLPQVGTADVATGATLRAAFEGWKRQREHPVRTLTEYERAIRLFAELHGHLPIVQIKRSHARQFREALRDVPRQRTGKLLKAPLPELAQWGREHPEAQKIGAGTINKLLGGAQAVCRWARREDLLPDDWADPFAEMRLGENQSNRAPFELDELRTIFDTPVFTKGRRPEGGQGEAAFWLPLLSLFGGERLSELAGLRVSDIAHNPLIDAVSISITEDRKAGRRLKTKQSERFVPVHPQLIKLGFLDFVAAQAKARGEKDWLFPYTAPGTSGAASFSKWFGRYLGAHGITDTAKVFHSFRHSFIDALRFLDVSDELKHALLGWSGGGIPAKYGAKDKAARFRQKLRDAVARVTYDGLDLSHLASRTRKTKHGL
jgi:integrase